MLSLFSLYSLRLIFESVKFFLKIFNGKVKTLVCDQGNARGPH